MAARRRKSDEALLLDIIAAAEAALRFIEGVDLAAFLGNEKDQFAVTRAVEIVGEAASRLSPEFRATCPDVPWRSIVGMRHRIAHDYDDLDLVVVWQVATEEMPVLLDRLRPMVPPKPDE